MKFNKVFIAFFITLIIGLGLSQCSGNNPPSSPGTPPGPSQNVIYAVDGAIANVTVIDGANNTVITRVPLAGVPTDLAVNMMTNRIYVTNNASNTVTVIDGASNTVISTIGVGIDPNSVAVNRTTNRIYVTNGLSGTVSVIDGSSNTLINTVNVGNGPWGIAVNETTNRIYAMTSLNNSVSVIDGTSNTVINTVQVNLQSGGGPSGTPQYRYLGVAVNETTNRVYVVEENQPKMAVIDGTSNTVIITVIVKPLSNGFVGNPRYRFLGIAVNETTNRVYVAHGGLYVIDGASNTVINTVDVVGAVSNGGFGALNVTVNETTNRIYVAKGPKGPSGTPKPGDPPIIPDKLAGDIAVIDGTNNTVITVVEMGGVAQGGIGVKP